MTSDGHTALEEWQLAGWLEQRFNADCSNDQDCRCGIVVWLPDRGYRMDGVEAAYRRGLAGENPHDAAIAAARAEGYAAGRESVLKPSNERRAILDALSRLPDGLLHELIMRFRAGGTQEDWDDPVQQVVWLLEAGRMVLNEYYQPMVDALRAVLAACAEDA